LRLSVGAVVRLHLLLLLGDWTSSPQLSGKLEIVGCDGAEAIGDVGVGTILGDLEIPVGPTPVILFGVHYRPPPCDIGQDSNR
jgi:hypothetical protein